MKKLLLLIGAMVVCVAAGSTAGERVVSLNGAWQLKGWPTPDRGSVRPYEAHQWLYTRAFTLDRIAPDEKAVLEFDGLDTLCDIFLNGRKIGEAADMFIPYAFDVTPFAREGANELAVLFRAPIFEAQFCDIAPIGDANSSAACACSRSGRRSAASTPAAASSRTSTSAARSGTCW